MSKRRYSIQAMKDSFTGEQSNYKALDSVSISSQDNVAAPPEETKQPTRKEIILLWKNIVVVTVSSTLVLTGLFANMALITSIVTDDKLASITLSLMSILELTCLFAPIFITFLGSRNVLVLGWWMITAFIASMFHPTYWTLIPGAIFLGVGWPLLATTVNVYVKDVTVLITKATNSDMNVLLVRIFGAVGFANQCGIVGGNLLAFFVLDSHSTDSNETNANKTLDVCGAHYCNENLEEEVQMKIPESWRILTLNCILTGLGVVGSLLLLTAAKVSSDSQDDRKKELSETKNESCLDSFKIALTPLKQALVLWKNPKQLLLFPYNLYLGFEVPFFLTEFTKAFISCPLGIPFIGVAMACFGITNMLFCSIQGHLVHWFGRLSVIIFGAITHMAALLTFLFWKMDTEHVYVYLILAAMLGIADSVVFTQGFAFCGIIHEDNTDLVYSNCVFFNNVASMFAFVYSYYLCVYVKIYIIAIFLILSIICLIFLEQIHKRSKLKSKPNSFST